MNKDSFMPKRLAIQLFGHLRTFDLTYQSFYNNIIIPNQDTYKIDIFIHTWDEIEYTALQWHNEKIPQVRGKKITSKDVDFLLKHYCPALYEITPQLEDGSGLEFDEFTGGKCKYATMRNVWYTKYRVNELRKKYEAEQDVHYDFVLCTRPDVSYNKKLNLDSLFLVYSTLLKNISVPEGKLFYSGHHRDYPVREDYLLAASDIVYLGVPSVINAISSIYPHLNTEELAQKFISWEHFQIYTAKKYNIEPIQIEYNYGTDWEILRFHGAVAPKKMSFINKVKSCIPIKMRNFLKKYYLKFIKNR